MRKTREFLLGPEGQTNYYHVVSRTAGRDILFGDGEKELFRILMLKQLKFSGLKALAWCFMGNHFHLLLEVPDKEAALQGWTEDDFIERLGVLRSEWTSKQTLDEVARWRVIGAQGSVRDVAESVRGRLFDLSMFMKELKLKMTLAYNKMHGRKGTLWEGAFKSVLLEGAGEGDDGSEALRTVAAYIDLNPVRAGLVGDPEEYRWCSYGAAVAGVRGARQGLCFAVTGRSRVAWRKVAAEYRCLLYAKGEEVEADQTVDGYEKGKGGLACRAEASDSGRSNTARLRPSDYVEAASATNWHSKRRLERIREVLDSGGRLPVAAALRCRVRYFTDGAVLGGQRFVDEFFESKKGQFGSRRKDGGRKMRGAQWGGLRVLRDLRTDVVG